MSQWGSVSGVGGEKDTLPHSTNNLSSIIFSKSLREVSDTTKISSYTTCICMCRPAVLLKCLQNSRLFLKMNDVRIVYKNSIYSKFKKCTRLQKLSPSAASSGG